MSEKENGATLVGAEHSTTAKAPNSLIAKIWGLVCRYGELVVAGYDWAANSIRSTIINPLSSHQLSTTVAEVTNATDATYNYYIDMDTYRKLGLQLELSCDAGTVTATVEGTIQNDGTAAASCTYQDITSDAFGVASLVASAGSASDMWVDNAEKLACFKYIKIKIVASTGGNTGDWDIYAKKLY